MKLSIKTQDPHHHHGHQPSPPPPPPPLQKNDQNHPLLCRAKIPITIFNLPFISGFSTTTHRPSDLSLSLSTNFLSGPTLKLSYSTATTTGSPPPPLTLTLKSGIGQFGSPKDSPLVISANFSYNPNQPNSSPTFSLLFKPQLGSFSLKKSTFSSGDIVNSSGFVPIERPLSLKDFSMDKNGKESILKGFSVTARTDMPVAKRILMSFRWGVNFPEDISKQAPYLTANKIRIERIEEVKEVKEKKSEGNGVDTDIFKGMCVWMKREVDVLQKENRELKDRLDDIRFGGFGRDGASRKRIVPVVEDSAGFEQWRSRKNAGEESSKKDVRKNGIDESSKKDVRKNGNGSGSRVSDVESELERAIKAASSS